MLEDTPELHEHFISFRNRAGLFVEYIVGIRNAASDPTNGFVLNSPSKWNRADTRDCPANAKTFSLYCALETATNEVSGKFEHRGAAMQEARFGS